MWKREVIPSRNCNEFSFIYWTSMFVNAVHAVHAFLSPLSQVRWMWKREVIPVGGGRLSQLLVPQESLAQLQRM